MRKIIFFLGFIALAACSADLAQLEVEKNLMLQGEMLFEDAANTLTMDNDQDLITLIEEAGLTTDQVESVGISEAKITLSSSEKSIAESLLLQVVSDNNQLITLGTLNPLPEGAIVNLKLAEEIDLKPYLEDSGCTWVLDLNLSGDADEMAIKSKIKLVVNYKEN
ncbi:MAG: hypothetical protein DA405_12415 [Bacteroidetes bacterium]|nr:MAG: hypothetical protein DA405_12415 [Bacteroidota bacterium]